MQAEEPATELMMPREKLLKAGPEQLDDAELLAIFLRTGTRGSDVVTLARQLISRFDGLRGLLQANRQDLLSEPGIGLAKYAEIAAVVELAGRYLKSAIQRGDALTDPDITRQFLMLKLRPYSREVFSCLFMDNQHRLITYEEMFFGTIDGASVHPREVVKRALEVNAAALIFAHNHPSGVAEPSQADRRITDRLQSALSLVDIRVLDHLVVGDAEVVSFAERGWI
ncbi:MAG: DNA repair protein RadC [Proteobacteria bacterium]|nr:DNA repair protein RadC [Pseudomonadota bacterium]